MSKKFKRILGLLLTVAMLLPMAPVYAGESEMDEAQVPSAPAVSQQEPDAPPAPQEPSFDAPPESSAGESDADAPTGEGDGSEEPSESEPEAPLPGDSTGDVTGDPEEPAPEEPVPEEPVPEEPEIEEPLPEALEVRLTSGARYAFANQDTIALTLNISGGVPEYSAAYSVRRDGLIVMESEPQTAAEGENSYSYAPNAYGTYETSVAVTDGQGSTASASVEIPVAEHDTSSAARQLRLAQSVTLTGDWRQDILLVARTQLGYRESERDFVIDGAGKRQGYTVYGDWYGMPYEEWCAMFVAYCSNYAKIPEEYFPQEAGCAKLLAKMDNLGAYQSAASGYEPLAGDLVFFNWDAESDPDHVGIVEAVSGNRIETIEGNNGRAVVRDSYARGDSRIMGYVNLDVLIARAFGEPEAEPAHVVELCLGSTPSRIEVPYGTAEEELPLPEALTAVYSDGTEGVVPVIWSCTGDSLGGTEYVASHVDRSAVFCFQPMPLDVYSGADPLLPTVEVAYEPEGEALILEFRYAPSSYAAIAAPYALSVSDDAIQLTKPDNLSKVTVSYQEGDNWVEITEENASDLPADASYQFEFAYYGISVDELLNSDRQMVYRTLPDWFEAIGSGMLLYNGQKAADIEVMDGVILITFVEEWLNDYAGNTIGGTFKVNGTVDWRELLKDGGTANIPEVGINMTFENGLAEKYGRVDIEKSNPTLVAGEDGYYYLKYELVVTSLEDTVMPDVTVKDLFGNLAYIAEYSGIGETPEELAQAASGFSPWE